MIGSTDPYLSSPRRKPVTGRRQAPQSTYDAVIIGAGVGGLTCANLLVRAGLSVLLVEQHYMAGGYCSTFRRKGYVFDAASHFYPLLGNPKTITGGLLRRLEIPTRWIKMDPVDRFHFPDRSSFSVPADLETYLTQLRDEFSSERASIDAFFEEVRRLYIHGLLEYFRDRPSKTLDPYRDVSLKDALNRRFRDPKLRLLLAADCAHWGSPPGRTSFIFDSMLRLSYFQGNYYPEGGSQVFADDLAQSFIARGGHLHLRTTALRIFTSRGRATGVELEYGPPKRRLRVRVEAEHIIASGDLLRVCEGMLDSALVDDNYLAGVRSLRPSMPCFLAHIGLQGTSQELLNEISGYYWNTWNSEEVGGDALKFKVFSTTLFEPRMAPPGGQIIIVQRVREVDFDAVDDWARMKADFERHTLSNLRDLIPRLDAKIVVMSSASARTSQRYTFNTRGAMLGWEMSPDQLGESRPALESPIQNLSFVGHWTRPGGGITPVIVSAMRAADRILGVATRPEV